MDEHVAPCFGYHSTDYSCEEATALREAAQRDKFRCAQSPTGYHSFSGGTACNHGCGVYLQQLMPDEGIGDES